MGFKFGNTRFEIGIVTVHIDNIDTDAMTASIRLEIPVVLGKISIRLHSGRNWGGERHLNAQVDFETNKPEPEEDEFDPMGGLEDEEERDSDQ